jgi:hypothetical protein
MHTIKNKKVCIVWVQSSAPSSKRVFSNKTTRILKRFSLHIYTQSVENYKEFLASLVNRFVEIEII